jgi:hypothetical protein
MRFQRGVRHGMELGKQGGILLREDRGDVAGDRFGREGTRPFPLPEIAPDGGAFDAEAAGDGGFGVARLHGSDNALAEIDGICSHDSHDTSAATTLQIALREESGMSEDEIAAMLDLSKPDQRA